MREIKLPNDFKFDEKALDEMREALCESTTGDCPEGFCAKCVFGSSTDEFKVWLSQQLKITGE